MSAFCLVSSSRPRFASASCLSLSALSCASLLPASRSFFSPAWLAASCLSSSCFSLVSCWRRALASASCLSLSDLSCASLLLASRSFFASSRLAASCLSWSGLLLGQLLGVTLGAGQLLVLLLLLLLQPVLLRLLQALAHLGGGQVVDQLLFFCIASRRLVPRRRVRLGRAGGLRRRGRLEQGLLGLLWSCLRRGRLRRLALLILGPVEGRQHGLGGHGGRDLNGGADVQRLGEVLDALTFVLETGDLEDAVEDIDLGDQFLGSEPVVVRQLQRLLELALRLVELAVVVGGRGRLIVRLDLGEDRLLIGGGGDGGDKGAGQRQSQRCQKSKRPARLSGHACSATSNGGPVRV